MESNHAVTPTISRVYRCTLDRTHTAIEGQTYNAYRHWGIPLGFNRYVYWNVQARCAILARTHGPRGAQLKIVKYAAVNLLPQFAYDAMSYPRSNRMSDNTFRSSSFQTA